MITVNGQVVSGGQPIDLSSMIGPDAPAHVRSALDQFGMGGQFACLRSGGRRAAAGRRPTVRPARPGVAALQYSSTPGEVTGSGSKLLVWTAAFTVVVLIGALVYAASSDDGGGSGVAVVVQREPLRVSVRTDRRGRPQQRGLAVLVEVVAPRRRARPEREHRVA